MGGTGQVLAAVIGPGASHSFGLHFIILLVALFTN